MHTDKHLHLKRKHLQTMRKIKWGIIGTGRIAREFAADFAHMQHGELVAIASRSNETARAFADQFFVSKAYGSYEALFKDEQVEAVYVATPHNFHFQNAADGLRAGKAVLCEKPITVNPNELHDLMDIARSTGSYLMEGMWTYFLPVIQKAQEWVNAGRIGKVIRIKADFGYPVPFDAAGRMYNPALAGGALLDMGIYPIAMAWLFYHRHPANIHVTVRKASTGVDDDVSMLFDYGDGTAELAASFRCKLFNHAFIIGEKGYIMLPDFWKAQACFLYHGEDRVDQFVPIRESFGFNFEADSVSRDLLSGRSESEVMPLENSVAFQKTMAAVMAQF